MFGKVEVNGPDRHPLYVDLVQRADAKGDSGDVRWNFEKFLISPDGDVVARYRTRTAPEDPGLRAAIEAILPS